MISKPFLSFTLGFLSLSKIGQTNLILQTLESYIVHPVKNPTLLISGSVVTITSLSQWNIFDRELQKDLEIVKRPFLKSAQKLGITEEQLLEKTKYYEEIGVMRRFAAILRHRDAGFVANGMIVWNVPTDKIDEVGSKLGAFPQVSHCYQRPVYQDWQYNVFSMIHCRSQEDAENMAKEIQKQIGVDDYRILFSSREFKKTRVEYFVEHEYTIEGYIPA